MVNVRYLFLSPPTSIFLKKEWVPTKPVSSYDDHKKNEYFIYIVCNFNLKIKQHSDSLINPCL